MPVPLVLLTSFFGLLLNLSFSGLIAQPDWSLVMLLAVLLSNRRTWFSVLPCIWFHDVVLFWSAWVTFPYVLVTTIILYLSDKRLGPGQPQRWLGLVLSCFPLLLSGVSLWSWLLSMMLTVWLWSILSSKREKVYVEPA